MLRRHPLLPFLAVLSTIVPSAASESTATLTIPTLSESITFSESITTITLEAGGVSVLTTTEQGREIVETHNIEEQVIVSTITESSTILIPTEMVLTTAVGHVITTPSPISSSTSMQRMTDPVTVPPPTSSASADATAAFTTSSNIIDAADESPNSSHSGLSAGSKAGVAVGTILGVLLLSCMAYFCLKARSEARPRCSTLGLNSWSDDGYNTSPTIASEKQVELAHSAPKMEELIEPEEMIHPAYVANSRFSDNMNLTGIVFGDENDQPMYIGVPAHVTGGERWGVPKADKHW